MEKSDPGVIQARKVWKLRQALADLVAAADNYFEEPSPENGEKFKKVASRARRVMKEEA